MKRAALLLCSLAAACVTAPPPKIIDQQTSGATRQVAEAVAQQPLAAAGVRGLREPIHRRTVSSVNAISTSWSCW